MRTLIAKLRRRALVRFARDEAGQGVVFAAITLAMLVAFVALVYNVGCVTERRVQVQLAADAAAYAGAVVEANSLSSIAWINSGMAQIYYNLTRYAVDVCTTGTLAELELRTGVTNGPGLAAYNPGDGTGALARARECLPRGKQWLLDLSRIQNSIALVTPRLMQEEMFAVALANGGERVSFYPSHRLFPRAESRISYRIEQFATGWRATQIVGPRVGEMIWVRKEPYTWGSRTYPDAWHIEWSTDGVNRQKVVIFEYSETEWVILQVGADGAVTREIHIVYTEDLGWVVWGRSYGEEEEPDVYLRFERVDMDGDGEREGTRMTVGSQSVVFRREGANLYVWNAARGEYENATSSTAEVGGVDVNVNVTNEIRIGGATVRAGHPTVVHIGRTRIVLSDPPNISAHSGPIGIHVRGFDANSFTITAGGIALSPQSADGRWHKTYDPHEEIWVRRRLTLQTPPEDPTAIHQWQYDYQALGGHLQYEPNLERFAVEHAIWDREGAELPEDQPAWRRWFDPTRGAPRQISSRQTFPSEALAPGSLVRPTSAPHPQAYYLTRSCPQCEGNGWVQQPNGQLALCDMCHARDHDEDGRSDVRVFLADVVASQRSQIGDGASRHTAEDYLDVRVFWGGQAYGVAQALMPLVLTEEFFKYGINVGVWRSPEGTPMEFTEMRRDAGATEIVSRTREPDWGFAAIASVRIGVGTGEEQSEDAFVDRFDNPDSRAAWVETARANFYMPSIRVRMVSSRRQIDVLDLEHLAYGTAQETPTSYLWDAILGTRYARYNVYGTWLTEYDGQGDPRVTQALRRMRNRQGRSFDITDPGLEDLVMH